jgi:hypothetical protein
MEYYEPRTKRLLAEFDLTVGRVEDLFAGRYGSAGAAFLAGGARRHIEGLIPHGGGEG